MIFNSISKELSNTHTRKGQYRLGDYQSIFQPTAHSRLNTNNSFERSLQMPDNGSALSQMNQRIVDNLQYLKYKDYVRQNQLKMSRISNRSNNSRHSHRSHHSQRSKHSIKSSSKEHAPTNSRYTVKTNLNEHYFPQFQTVKPEFQKWQRPTLSRYQPTSSSNSNYRQFLRKPITIEEYSQKYGNFTIQNRRPEKDIESFQPILPNLKSPLSQHFNTQERFRQPKEISSKDVHSVTSPVNRDWTNSFSDKFPKEDKTTAHPQTTKTTNGLKQEIQSQRPLQVVSPLSQSLKTRKDGMIVAFALVGLGLLLFILQTIK